MLGPPPEVRTRTIPARSWSTEWPRRRRPARRPTPPRPKTKGTKAKKPPATTAAAPPPLIDTTLAAQAAAKQLVAGLSPPMATPAAGRESASFKQLKQSLAHPAGAGLDGVLDKTASAASRKPNTPFTGPRGASGGGGRNQTFGADVNRSGVPRRTSGG